MAEIEERAMELPENERAALASHLLRSLPSPLIGFDDEALAEAERRDEELEEDPSIGLTTEQLRSALGR